MGSEPGIVIVGANLAGGAAATTLRSEGYQGSITLVGDEPHPPYERPPLSKEYLRGETGVEDALLHPVSWYESNGVELRLGERAAGLDPGDHAVRLEGGEPLAYERLLVATGGRNRRLHVPGADLSGIFQLRTIEDADRIRTEAVAGRTVVIAGAGFIGCEVAASMRTLGLDVHVVEPFEVPLERALGRTVGAVFEGIHRDHGVRLHLGQSLERFEGTERVEAVLTDGGIRIGADMVVVGVGIRPNIELLSGSGIPVGDGVLVDARCRTGAPDVYAAGDVANHDHPLFGRVRVEHWDNALKQGAAAARNMMGADEPFDDPHWFWSDQYEYNLQCMGWATDPDALVVRGSLDERSFVAFYVNGGVVESVAGLNRGKDVRRSAGLIRAHRPVDPALLRDEDVDLRKLAIPSNGHLS